MKLKDKLELAEKRYFNLTKKLEAIQINIWELKNRLEPQGVFPFTVMYGNEEPIKIFDYETLKREVLKL